MVAKGAVSCVHRTLMLSEGGVTQGHLLREEMEHMLWTLTIVARVKIVAGAGKKGGKKVSAGGRGRERG